MRRARSFPLGDEADHENGPARLCPSFFRCGAAPASACLKWARPSNSVTFKVGEQDNVVVSIAARLGETAEEPCRTIQRIVEERGAAFALTCLERAAEIEAKGGLFLEKHQRRRTFGGVFFHIVREAVGLHEWNRLRAPPVPLSANTPPKTPPAPSPSRRAAQTNGPAVDGPPWEEAIAVVAESLRHPGQGYRLTATVIGRPGRVEVRGTYVVASIATRKVPDLPQGLPVPPRPHVQNTVLLTLGHWNRVKDSLAQHPDDLLIAEGYGVFVPELKTFAVFASGATTLLMKRAQKEAQRTMA
jgi:hypothetical protein